MTEHDRKPRKSSKCIFLYSHCKCLFVKSNENVTKTHSFCVFAVFFLTIRLTSIGKSSFVRCTKPLGCLHFGRFEAINSWIYIVSVASLYWEMIFWTNVSFHCFQYARYVFDDTITKMSGFVKINTIGHCPGGIHLEGWKCTGNHGSNVTNSTKNLKDSLTYSLADVYFSHCRCVSQGIWGILSNIGERFPIELPRCKSIRQ